MNKTKKQKYCIIEFIVQSLILIHKNVTLLLRRFILTSVAFIIPVVLIIVFKFGSDLMDNIQTGFSYYHGKNTPVTNLEKCGNNGHQKEFCYTVWYSPDTPLVKHIMENVR
jgi:hypothetical protein